MCLKIIGNFRYNGLIAPTLETTELYFHKLGGKKISVQTYSGLKTINPD